MKVTSAKPEISTATSDKANKNRSLPGSTPGVIERADFVSEIHEAFQNMRVVILAQKPEINCQTGKTEITKDFMHKHKNEFEQIFWVDPDQLLSDSSVLDQLYQNENWLLVLDGMESEKQLSQAGFILETLRQHGKILITSRNNHWNIPAITIPVGLYSKEEALTYLLKQFPACTQISALKIATSLGFVPSSVANAASEIKKWGISLENYFVKRTAVLEERSKHLQKQSNLPPRNPNFVGREVDLVALEEAMSQDKPLVLAAATGLGGIGKTQVALQFAYRNASNYTAIGWINAENDSTLLSSYQELAKYLKIPSSENVIHDVNQYLKSHPGWLIILDNVLNPKLIENLLPQSGGHVLITSRYASWEKIARVFKVGLFNPEESVELLMNITGLYDQEKEALELANTHLHNLPLAIAQAASYIKETNISIQEYIEKFQEKHKILWNYETPPKDLYQHTVNVTWNLTMSRIKEEEQEFIKKWNLKKEIVLPLMQSCSLFGAKDIPREILLQRWIKFHLGKEKEQLELNQALTFLSRYSMIDLTKDHLSVHALVQTVIRDGLSKEGLQDLISQMNHFFREYQDDGKIPLFAYWDTEPKTINNLYRLIPHGLSLASHAESIGLKEEATSLLLTIGAFSYHQGDYALAKAVLKQALNIEESAGIYKNLGNV